MVKLGQAGSHLTASGAWGRDDHQRSGGFDIVIFPIAVVADNVGDIVGITVNGIVAVHPDS